MAKITAIHHDADSVPSFNEVNIDLARKVRVAAYCGVSTLAEEQDDEVEDEPFFNDDDDE